MAASTAFFQSLRFISDGISYVNSLNKSLTQVAIVTGQTQDQVSQLGKEYQKLAYNMGVTTQNFADASVEYYRQGLTQQEVMDRANKTIQYAKISNLDFAKSAEILTATTNSMNVSITHAADVFSYLGDATSSGADEIGVAFQKVGGSAGALNLNFEKVASWIAEISSKTRESATTVGDSIRSILARIQSLKETGFTEEGQNVNQVAKALNEVGIQLMDSQGQFRNFGTIMDELGAKWKTLDSRQKAYIATTVAGTYQQSRFENLMNGYSDSVKLYQQSLDSAGTTQKKFDTYMQSTEAHLNRLSDSWTNVFQDTFHSNTINSAIDLLTGLANGVDGLVHTFGTLPIAAGLATVAIMAFNTSMRESSMVRGMYFIDTLKNLPTYFSSTERTAKAATVAEGVFAGATETLGVAVRGLGVALKTTFTFLAGSFLPIAGVMLLSYGIEKLTGNIAKQHQEEQKIQDDLNKSSQNYQNNAQQIDQLVSKYKELDKLKNSHVLNNDQEKEYYDTMQKLANVLPAVVAGVDSKGRSIIVSSKYLDENIKLLKEKIKLERDAALAEAPDKNREIDKKIAKLKEELDYWNRVKKADEASLPYAKNKAEADTARAQIAQEALKIKELEIQINNAEASRLGTVERILSIYDSLNNSDVEWLSKLGADGKKSYEEVDKLGKAINTIRENLGNGISTHFLEGLSDKKILTLATLTGKLKDGAISTDQFSSALEKAGFKSSDVAKILVMLAKAQNDVGVGTKQSTDIMQKFSDALKDTSKYADFLQSLLGGDSIDTTQLEQLINTYGILNGQKQALIATGMSEAEADKALGDKKAVLDEVIRQLTNTYPDLIEGKNLNIKAAKNEILANDVLREAANKASNGLLNAQQTMTLNTVSQTNARIKKMRDEIEGLKALQTAFQRVSKQTSEMFNNMSMAEYQTGGDAKMAQQLKIAGNMMNRISSYGSLDDLESQLNSLLVNRDGAVKKLADQIGYTDTTMIGGNKSGNGKTKKPKTTADNQQVNKYATDAFSQALAKLDLQLKESDARLGDLDKSSQAYRDELKHQIDLIEQEEKLTKNQIDSLNKKNTALKHQLSSMGAYNKLSNAQKQTYNDIAKAIDDNINKINDLSGAMIDYGNKVKDIQSQVLDSFSAVNDMITNNINTAMQASDDSYDSQIKKLQEKLDLMDQEYAKEDRIAKLRDLQNEIDATKADKRFEKITADGKKILTYDEAKVSDLQKQQDDLVQQYNREDAKKAIQDEIDRLQNEKDQKHQLYEQQVSDMKDFWDTITKAFQDGSITLDQFMKDFYGNSLEEITKYAGDVGKQTEIIKQLFSDLSKLKTDAAKYGTGNNGAGSTYDQRQENNNKLKTDAAYRQSEIDRTKAVIYNRLKQGLDVTAQEQYLKQLESYHTGGIVSSTNTHMTEIANKLLNTKLNPNEQVIKVLKGELLSPAANIAQNLIPNLRMIMGTVVKQPTVVQSGDTITLNNVTIKANNADEFMKSLSSFRRSVRT